MKIYSIKNENFQLFKSWINFINDYVKIYLLIPIIIERNKKNIIINLF